LSKVPKRFSRVSTNTIEFIGLKDSEKLLSSESYEFYIPISWSESRFYRNIKSVYWCDYRSNGPSGVGAAYYKRIKVFHFPFRSDDQIIRRMKIRNQNRETSGIPWHNVNYESKDALIKNYKKILEK